MEFAEISLSFVWLVIAIIFGIFELATTSLVSIWFVIGAVLAMLVSITGLPLWFQIFVFILSSVLVIVFLRPIAMKHINGKAAKTNLDAMIGRILIAKTDIDNIKMTGKADIDGSTWLVVSKDDSFIPKDEKIRVVGIEGAKLIVERMSS